ncbi:MULTISPECIES: bile acid:sodium symporter family protein [unclassified Neisseria]|uniref:bile acid:sodium symporter family protein n=1 Tax=unclassified Neisseria TaxID=2623750 RepID=UPI001071E115|nr:MULTISPECIES: bile acid:sodium symporter [unclassified Neisseria]MBF0803644.1 bile acid:sodium symporter family protein [Neisseria sp. 19428wB4_WF04]TFU43639.1 bile acid:sodium symporter family protein [Neisseria sp. WF04]
MNPVFIVLPVLLLLMFGLGLSFKPADFAVPVRQPKAVLAGVSAQIVLLPLLAGLVVWLFRPEPYLMVGLVLIACSPGGSSSNIFTALAKGDVPLSIVLTVASSIITVFTIPPVLLYALDAAGLGGAAVKLPVGQLLVQNVVLVLLPLLLGMVVRYARPDFAQKAKKGLDKAAFPALVVLAAVFFAANRQIIVQHFAALAGMVSLLIVAAMGLGGLLAAGLGLPGRQRRTIVIEVGMQNAAQAIAVAGSPFVLNNEAFALPAVIYALMMNVVLTAYLGLCRLVKG